MKHAVILADPGMIRDKKHIEAVSFDGKRLFLVEQEYTDAEMELFKLEKEKWIIRRAGIHYFLADSDSGEDARGYYCGYFDLIPPNAVFENGRPVGYYLCAGGFQYSGRGRSSFDVDRWGYPGDDPFSYVSWGNETHVFLFAETATHEWKDWDLLIRDPEKEYRSYLDFKV
ncbi:MAG: hypothetical protein IJM17_05425 [Firmicutes bacterium]|nr:hypothetical protein [Bacillota bacterium]